MTRHTLIIAAVLIVIGATLVGLQQGAAERGQLSVPERVGLGILRGVQQPLTVGGRWISDVGRVIIRHGSITQENRDLRDRLNYLQNENTRLRRYSRENTELRKLLELPSSPAGESVAAEVLSFDATNMSRQIGIGVGAADGIHAKDAVYAPAGVVGQIQKVSPHYSTVILLTDRRSGVGAANARNGARGVLLGTGGSLCKMQYVDIHADIRRGDTIITSGDSRIFAHGTPLGTVVSVEKDAAYSRITAWIDPAVSFDTLTAVLVRTDAE